MRSDTIVALTRQGKGSAFSVGAVRLKPNRSVVIAELCQEHRPTLNLVDHAVLVGNTARAISGQGMLQPD